MSTKIPYAEQNWETVGGCDKIKSGCKNCYATKLIHRFSCNPVHKGRYKGLVKDGNWTGKIELFHDRLEQPLHREIPTTYFINSRSDTFHKDVPFEFIAKMFAIMAMCPQHKFLLFTKRWERAAEFYQQLYEVESSDELEYLLEACEELGGGIDTFDIAASLPMDNVHLYFSAGTQAESDEAWKWLEPIPVAVRGFSFEPLLEEIYLPQTVHDHHYGFEFNHREAVLGSVIVGCESGPKRRPCVAEWIHDIVRHCQCAAPRIAPYVKQMEIHGKVETDPKKFPKRLQVREMPI